MKIRNLKQSIQKNLQSLSQKNKKFQDKFLQAAKQELKVLKITKDFNRSKTNHADHGQLEKNHS